MISSVILALGVVLTHAHVVTEATPADASVLAYRDGKVVYVGDDEAAARRAAGTPLRVQSLDGATVVPGFNDAHVHYGMAATLGGPHGRYLEAPTRAVWLSAVEKEARAGSGSDWLFVTTRHLPDGVTARDLERFARPLFVITPNGGLINERGRALAGLAAELAPNGFVRGGLMAGALARLVERLPHTAQLEAARALLAELAQNGITSVQLISDDVAPLFEELRRAGQLTARVRVVPLGHLVSREFFAPSESRVGAHDDPSLPEPSWVRRYGVKYFHDDDNELSRAELARILDEESARGEPILFHVLSSHALDRLLEAVEKQHATSRHPAQVRMEHLDEVSPMQAARIAKLGLWVCTNPSMIPEWRQADAFPLHTLASTGVNLCFGSDYVGLHQPARPLSPLDAILQAITHGGWGQAQRIDGSTALRAFTVGSAGAEERPDLGTLAEGQRADLVVLSADPRTLPPERFGELRVLSTVIDGREVFHAAPLPPPAAAR